MKDPASSFARVADAYDRARPGYAPAAVDQLVSELGLGPGRVVVDLAAGTGKLARQLLPSGARVVAVEPLAELRALVPPEIDVLEGTAEAIPLDDASADAVTVAQAFHWFDERRATDEIARILRPGGALAIVTNRRDETDPLQRSYGELLQRHRGHPPLEPPPSGRAFPHVHHVESLAELASTESSIATLDDERRTRALADFAALGGGDLRYVTYVEIRSPGSSSSRRGAPAPSRPPRP